MSSNTALHDAKKTKNDEFYTQYSDIEREINAYLDFNPEVFQDKVILLPCDDPEWSNFTKYFAQNFERLGLKKLISTSYAADSKPEGIPYKPTRFETESPKYDENKTRKRGKIFILERDINKDKKININDLEWRYLDGDGDFRSKEVTKLRDESDFVITNPPFSLWREFLQWVIDGKKSFAFIGNKNALGWKDVFPSIKNNIFWTGYSVPTNFLDEHGNITKKVNGLCRWFTMIDHGRRHKPLNLMTMEENKRYSKHKDVRENGYPRYDNYDAIDITWVDSIPSDYDGIMGVPITFFDKYCPEQFEVIGSTQRGCHKAVPETRQYDDFIEINWKTGKPTGSSGNKTNGNGNIAGIKEKNNYFINEKTGETVHSAYSRIFIKHKEPK